MVRKEGLEQGREEGIKEGIKDGTLLKEQEIVLKLNEKNYTIEEIMDITSLTEEEIIKIFNKQENHYQ